MGGGPQPGVSADGCSIEYGVEARRGSIVGNVMHTPDQGDVHFSLRVPGGYDGTPCALPVCLPGWGGERFQGAGADMAEEFAVSAAGRFDDMVVASAQLDDWGRTSAEQAVSLTQGLMGLYSVDPDRVYLIGYSGGGETGSIVMGMRPGLYAAFLCCSSRWDGDMSALVSAKTPVHLAVGEGDSYYGPGPPMEAYSELRSLYEGSGTDGGEIGRMLVLDAGDASYFAERGYADQHAGGQAFAHDDAVMGWLFGEHRRG